MRSILLGAMLVGCTGGGTRATTDAGRIDAFVPVCDSYDSLDTSCTGEQDCILVGETMDCCGHKTSIPINATELSAFQAIESCLWQCEGQGCALAVDAGGPDWRVICGADSHCQRVPIEDAGP